MRHYINIITHVQNGVSGNQFKEYDNVPMTFYDLRSRLGSADTAKDIDMMLNDYLATAESGSKDKVDQAVQTAERQARYNRSTQTYMQQTANGKTTWSVMKNGAWQPIDSLYEQKETSMKTNKKYTKKQISEAIKYWEGQLKKMSKLNESLTNKILAFLGQRLDNQKIEDFIDDVVLPGRRKSSLSIPEERMLKSIAKVGQGNFDEMREAIDLFFRKPEMTKMMRKNPKRYGAFKTYMVCWLDYYLANLDTRSPMVSRDVEAKAAFAAGQKAAEEAMKIASSSN